jgi:hypothetical protein
MAILKNSSPYQIFVGDSKIKDPNEIYSWCKKLPGFITVIMTDVSDVSYIDDIVYAYSFETQEELNWFKLRWM